MSCNLFDKEERLLQTIRSANGNVVKFYCVELGATTNEVIQVKKMNKENDEVLVKAFEHNFLKNARFVTSDSVSIILSDTTIYAASKVNDTVGIVLK